jgi:predicted  nucleic acid-binding Zn-ribbon protein
MSGPAATFREIHRLRRLVHDLQEQLDRIPRQLKAQQAKLARHEEQHREAQEAVKKSQVGVKKREGELKDAHALVARLEKVEVSSKKEYDALQAEIAHARAECQRLEDEILAGLMEGEERAAALPEQERLLQQGRDELAKFEQESAGRKTSLASQLAAAQAQLKEAETNIPADLRTQYNRIVTAKGPDSMAVVRDRTCKACHTEITVQSSHDLQQEMFVVCRSCGRILYLPEQAAPPEGED